MDHLQATAIYADQVKTLYRLSAPAYLGTLAVATIAVFALLGVVETAALLSWLALVAVVTIARLVVYRRYNREQRGTAEASVWASRFVVGASAMGCLWGVLGSLLLPTQDIVYLLVVIFIVGGMVASAVIVLTPVRAAFNAFMLLTMVPLVTTVCAQGDHVSAVIGTVLVAFSAVMLFTGHLMHHAHVSTLRMRFENSGLVERLSDAYRQAEQSNRQMAEQLAEQKMMQHALHRSSDRLEALIESSPLAIIVHDSEGAIRRWNHAAERLLGWCESEACGLMELTAPVEAAPDASTAVLAPAVWQAGHFETEIRRRDGRLISVDVSAAPLRCAEGHADGKIVMLSDVSERRNAERLQRLEHAVTRILSEASSVEEAMTQVLRAIGELAVWAYGARWVLDANGTRMECRDVWHEDRPEISVFAAAYRRRTSLASAGSSGLRRRVLGINGPVWIPDIAADGTLKRADELARAGLRSGFAFPVMMTEKCYGVLEFFGCEVRARDDALMRIASALGSQIGQFVARKEAESRLTYFANHDALTGLPNRAMFSQQLTQALARARRNHCMAAVMFVDLDRFKIINDTLGHDAGDRLLKQLALQLRDCLRGSDTLGRQGGDEFVVLVEDITDPNHVSGVAHKILEAASRPFMLGGQEYTVTGSVGISVFPADGTYAQALLKNADIAMYRAKEQGRNNFQFYSEQMNLHTFERLALETSLRRAVEREEFLLHYQPKLDIRSGRITGAEALVRWQHPELGMVPPAQFIPLAEETGLIVPIGEWVLRTACAQACTWSDVEPGGISVAVNLSARQFGRDDLPAIIATVLQETGLPAELLELEITESAVMHNADRAAQLLQQIKQLGVRISIDDFGTGYSSLGYLKRFPIDSVKIDRSFIRDIPDDRDDVAITRAVIAMSHSLRLKVIAEGVENEGQYRFLREHDCEEIQGYYFSKPLDAAGFLRVLTQAIPAALVA